MKKEKLIHENLEGEEWRISAQTNELEVSNLGRVRSAQTGYVRKFSYTEEGYARVPASKSRKTYLVHRLVYETFVGPVGEKEYVTFKDGRTTNLKVENLELRERKEIPEHAVRPRKPSHQKLSKQKVLTIWENVGKISNSELARALGVNRSTIMNVLSGLSWDWVDHPNKGPYREEKQRRMKERFGGQDE